MSVVSDIQTLWHLLASQPRLGSHADRMQSFYSKQSQSYDLFRERLLQGRRELMEALPIRPGGCLVDCGGGTGRNIEWLEPRLSLLRSVTIVDLCPDLLEVAKRRIRENAWSNVRAECKDVTTYPAAKDSVDVMTFSYSLTMIPNWVDAIEHAYSLLAPDGIIGVTDFYVSAKWPAEELVRHSSLARFLWPAWFSHSNVFLNPGHLQLLRRRFKILHFKECTARVPYLFGLRVPYYILIGSKQG